MIEIAAYDDTWPDQFEAIAARLREVLGTHALRIDHIGSTSVPGLAAKDVIDLQVTVHDFTLLPEIREAMAAGGYVYRAQGGRDHTPAGWVGDETEWEKAYFRETPGEREVHVHLRAEGRANQRYALLFRDYLRDTPAVAASYAAFKRVLAAQLPPSVDERARYAETKDPVLDIIMAQAERWAGETGWRP